MPSTKSTLTVDEVNELNVYARAFGNNALGQKLYEMVQHMQGVRPDNVVLTLAVVD